MANSEKITAKYITFLSLADFQGSNGLGTSNLITTPVNGYVGRVPYYSTVFIELEGLIWSKGRYYGDMIALEYSRTNTNAISLASDQWTDLQWTELTSLSDGSYVLQATQSTCMYTGYMSFKADTGQSTSWEDEIILHTAGNIDSNYGRLYFKLVHDSASKTTKMYASTSKDASSTVGLTIKLKKLI